MILELYIEVKNERADFFSFMFTYQTVLDISKCYCERVEKISLSFSEISRVERTFVCFAFNGLVSHGIRSW